MIKLTVPLPPSINHAYFFHNGRRIKTKKTKDYELSILKILENLTYTKLPDKTKIIMELTYFFPDHRIRDTHNTPKIIIDCLEKHLFTNDYWVLPRIMDFTIEPGNPRLEISLFVKR